ncbi:MAG: beta-N-acetylhexosaminidase [Micromonosporaceae bacterium]|nr:beta-N-acetylhexosaminidase [Micromonosporaceae bacterium]
MSEVDLVPRPAQLTVHDGQFTITPETPVHAPNPIAELLREVVGGGTGFPGGGEGTAEISFIVVEDAQLGAEGYRLRVSADGIRAEGSDTGLRWAIQTLRQLLPAETFGGGAPAAGARWPVPCLEIVDRPQYPWRGSLLDVARWCHPVKFLYRYVDLLAMHKLNILHLHLTDDQGWRFEVQRYPKLTEIGAHRTESHIGHARDNRFDSTRHSGWYSQQELRDLVRYAARRGVRIMPEVDVPGHMQAAIAAYPELGNDPHRKLDVATFWGISSHILNVADDTVHFVQNVLDEVVDVFPFDVVHVGGDEVPPDEWMASAAAADRVRLAELSAVDQLLGWWASQLSAHLAGYGRRIGVWDELLDNGVPPGSLVFAWREAHQVAAAQQAGFDVVAAPQEFTYFDWAEAHSPDEPVAIAGVVPLERVYSYQPGEVIGVQGQLWSEYLPTPELVEWRAFPRLTALSEVGWSPGAREFGEFRERLTGHLRRLDAMGVNYRPPDLEPSQDRVPEPPAGAGPDGRPPGSRPPAGDEPPGDEPVPEVPGLIVPGP